MGGLSPFHWLIIAVVVLLLFGNRLPSVMAPARIGSRRVQEGAARHSGRNAQCERPEGQRQDRNGQGQDRKGAAAPGDERAGCQAIASRPCCGSFWVRP